MKTTHIIAGLVIASFVSPIAFADSNSNMGIPKRLLSGDFCTNITEIESMKNTLLDTKKSKLIDKFGNKADNRSNKRDGRDESREDKRNYFDDNSAKSFEALRKQATTDAEKAAVEKFITTMTTAKEAKRTAMDALIASERATIDAKIKEKTGLTTTGVDTLKSALESAIAKAKADCADKVDSNTVKSEFKKTMETAHSSFKDLRNDKSIKAEMDKYRESHKVETQKIEDTFRTTAENAKAELLKSLPNAKMQKSKRTLKGMFQNLFKKNQSTTSDSTN